MKKEFTLGELAELTEVNFVGDKNHLITGVNALDEAGENDVSFLANLRYVEAMKQSKAGVVCISDDIKRPNGKNYLISHDPSRTFQQIAEILLHIKSKTGFVGIHSSCVIHKTAKIGKGVTICPNVVIDQDAVIGEGSIIGPFVYIGSNVTIGQKCYFHSHSVVRERCIIGNRVILQPGAIIGSCGFGYIQDQKGYHRKLEQIGIVVIEDDVEIGSNTTIDRARFKVTLIRRGTKIDNLVQIAHNTEIGESNIIAAQSGLAGSVKTGKGVMLGGQVGVLGHVELVDHVMVATRGGVSKSLRKPGKYRGSPAIPISEYSRNKVHSRRLEQYAKSLKQLEEKIQKLEKKLQDNH